MTSYQFHLENGAGPSGDITDRELPSDEHAIKEAGAAAGEVLLSELGDGRPRLHVLVRVQRDGQPLAIVRAEATIERFA